MQNKSKLLSRRQFLSQTSAIGATALLAACQTTGSSSLGVDKMPSEFNPKTMYAPVTNEKFPLPAINLSKIPSKFYRRRVDYTTKERVGTVIVDTKEFFLHVVEEDGKAMRYGVGLGRAGFEWSGRANIAWKRKWPTWTPPEEMIKRQPELEKYSYRNGGMEPGPKNPLGARALYIFQNGEDTLYRLHGTAEDWSIGKSVSSGCVRLLNQDIIDLYGRVPNGARIRVI